MIINLHIYRSTTDHHISCLPYKLCPIGILVSKSHPYIKLPDAQQ